MVVFKTFLTGFLFFLVLHARLVKSTRPCLSGQYGVAGGPEDDSAVKIAVTGKGGVGKTTLSALLCHLYASEGKKVIAVDADPDANLAQALGIPRNDLKAVKPIAEMADLIEQRTGAKPGSGGGLFRINPRVDDIPGEYGYRVDGITLLIMGKSKFAASGCYCPEHALLRRLLKHLIVERDEAVIVDMEAGIEHLTRGTAEGVDAFIVVIEPGQRSIQTALSVKQLAGELGVRRVFAVANKVRKDEDVSFIRSALTEIEMLGAIRFNDSITESDVRGLPSYRASGQTIDEVRRIKKEMEKSV